jgi:hypothetical protein
MTIEMFQSKVAIEANGALRTKVGLRVRSEWISKESVDGRQQKAKVVQGRSKQEGRYLAKEADKFGGFSSKDFDC